MLTPYHKCAFLPHMWDCKGKISIAVQYSNNNCAPTHLINILVM